MVYYVQIFFIISNIGNLNIDMRTYFSLFLLVTTQVVFGVNFSGYLDQSIIRLVSVQSFMALFSKL